MNDPYSGLVNHMREQGAKYNPPAIQIGIVISSDPLTIKVGDLQLDKDDILVADYLLKNYKLEINMPLTDGTGVISSSTVGDHGDHTHTISKLGITKGIINSRIGLIKDDAVVMLATEDEQKYIVLARVVSL
ncbi:DUF2577 domain-containing protein [Clostridium tagluense]|uniref:DUF2577 domain-containing protein n=1 Tax=Clostridium tagluense TaxID=360422 RepID=UPI001C6E614A|nr:DUF2577 domain-containing protein [Clostridium tagluense]MBW9158867.1 DUF2577 domain-containing protein [Clostridium tagluense]WLC67155.1 DUF2577 domain-containing protein [Clostridium tagluense]